MQISLSAPQSVAPKTHFCEFSKGPSGISREVESRGGAAAVQKIGGAGKKIA
jgi:hypothetical protein